MTRVYSTFYRTIALAVTALLAAAGHAQIEQLVPPPFGGGRPTVPVPLTYAQPQGGALMTFKSPREGAPEFAIKGVLFKPTGAARGRILHPPRFVVDLFHDQSSGPLRLQLLSASRLCPAE